MLPPKITVDRDLNERLLRAAQHAGYSTTEEFVQHVLERAIARLEDHEADQEVEKQLRGLGYLE